VTVNIAILGLGSMGRAILTGLLAPETALDVRLTVTNNSVASAAEWESAAAVTALAVEADADANRKAVVGARVVIGAVKPWQILGLLDEIAPTLEPGSIFVSVAAGIPIAAMQARLPEQVTVLRAMPNTPAIVGRGVTGLSAGPRASSDDIALVRSLFEAVGDVVVVDESAIDALSAVSGSGPAYVFYVIEQWMNSAQAFGFSEADARTMVLGTVLGAAELLEASGEEPAELRRRVTSPNGTTEQAIRVFDEAELGALFDRAMDAAIRRSHEIAAEFGE
jgi:pyrroline-5-carboxylate reductase